MTTERTVAGAEANPLLGDAGARRAEHGRHMPVRQAALDHEGVLDQGHGHAAAWQDLQAFDDLGGQRR
jgi:hypothetical protein